MGYAMPCPGILRNSGNSWTLFQQRARLWSNCNVFIVYSSSCHHPPSALKSTMPSMNNCKPAFTSRRSSHKAGESSNQLKERFHTSG